MPLSRCSCITSGYDDDVTRIPSICLLGIELKFTPIRTPVLVLNMAAVQGLLNATHEYAGIYFSFHNDILSSSELYVGSGGNLMMSNLLLLYAMGIKGSPTSWSHICE